MHLYSGPTAEFINDATRSRIAEKIADSFFDHFRYKAPQSEVRSWQQSLRAMSTVLDTGGLTDHGIIVEYQLPLSSRRLDCMVTGTNTEGDRHAVIVELKQWESAGPTWVDDCVTTFLGGGTREVLHPSRQVGNYHRYLLDVHTAFNDGGIGLKACSYLHNLRPQEAGELTSDKFTDLLISYPLFGAEDVDDLMDYMSTLLGGGDNGEILETVIEAKYRPNKRLLDHTASVIKREPTFTLLDEQQVAFNAVLAKVRAMQLKSESSAFLIEGGPGTGKSLIAVNLLAELAGQGYVVQHATGSKAFTESLRKTVGTRAGALFSYFNSFMKAEPQSIDLLVADESHRIRENSENRFTKKEDRTGKPQVDELLDAAKVAVFLIDDMQVVRPGELGSADLIRQAVAKRGIDLYEYELETQFRCGGSEGYVQWVENTLGLRKTPTVLWDPHESFDFDVVDSAYELEALVRSKADDGQTARLSAGFCWRWSKPNEDGSLVNDVQLEDWSMPWNAKPDARGLQKGIPKSHYWATDPAGIDQVGCIYTAQGFEYDFAGVIWGRDLVYRPGEGWVAQPEFSHDSVVKRSAKNDPDLYLALVKNTYRVLLTRGLQGCAVYFEDQQTRDFVLSRIES